jgi:hypothetical protein
MRNEGLFLVAFIVLAVTLLIMVTRSSTREHFDPPMDPIIRTNKLEEDVKLLDERMDKVEGQLSSQNAEINQAQSEVDTAATSIAMVT